AVSGFAQVERPRARRAASQEQASAPDVVQWDAFLNAWLSHPNITSKRWIYEQYDSTVQGQTELGPGAEAAVVMPPEIAPRAIAMTADCPSRYLAVDADVGGAHCVAGAMRNLACVWAEPIGLTDCLNFGSPEDPYTYDD